MNEPLSVTCEIQSGGKWVRLGIDEAVTELGLKMRCPECGGAVRPHREAVNGMRAHFEHELGHSGCSLSHAYHGVRSRHPKPLR
jgi:hypothetical protein